MVLRCFACKESIDDDSCFCDQCGKEIYRCTSCGHLGKGPRCPQDGLAMQPRRQASVVGSGNEPGRSGAVRLRLRCPSLGVDLLANPGDLLGRRYGPHVQVLERFSQISSRHLELGRGSDGRWTAKDLNSFNHSYYNGVQLVPEVAVALDAGGVLSLGDIALTVVLE